MVDLLPTYHLYCIPKYVTEAWGQMGVAQECDRAFNLAKKQLLSSQILAHFNAELSICLATDASAYGLGAVLSHHMPNGEERPIAFASRTLSPAERNYSQLEKEALSIFFGIKKFHQYIYGRSFTLLTDHKLW